jgi:hypothetical protein
VVNSSIFIALSGEDERSLMSPTVRIPCRDKRLEHYRTPPQSPASDSDRQRLGR